MADSRGVDERAIGALVLAGSVRCDSFQAEALGEMGVKSRQGRLVLLIVKSR
jgi:hypothetical protein